MEIPFGGDCEFFVFRRDMPSIDAAAVPWIMFC